MSNERQDVICEACEAGLRLGQHGIHYDDARGGWTWGVCRKVVAQLTAEQAPEMRRFVSGALRRARAATSLDEVYALADILQAEADEQVFQARTCSTCRSLVLRPAHALCCCLHPDGAALTLSEDKIDSWGCLLWEQAETKEGE